MRKYLLILSCLSSWLHATIDFQIWNKNFIFGQFNRKLDLFADIEFRYKNSGRTFYYNHEHIELPIHVTSFLTIGPAYRQIFTLVAGQRNQWVTTYYPNVNFTFLWHIGVFNFYDRNRVVYTIRPTTQDAWEYRNKLGVYYTLTKKAHGIRLFADEEIFMRERRHGIYQNRATVGLDLGLFRKVRLIVAYRYRIVHQTQVGWEHNNILVLDATANF